MKENKTNWREKLLLRPFLPKPWLTALTILNLTAAHVVPVNAGDLEPPLAIAPGTPDGPGPLLEDATVQFIWQPVSNALSYSLSVRDITANNALQVLDAKSTNAFTTLIAGHEYRWNMVAMAGTNYGGRSETRYFRILVPLVHPRITEVSPYPPPTLDGSQAFTIYGEGFRKGCEVILRGKDTGEVYRNRKVLFQRYHFVTIAPYFTGSGGNWSVEVINPGEYSSGEFPFPCLPAEAIPAWRWWRSGWPWAWGGFLASAIAGACWWWTARRRLPKMLDRTRHHIQREERDRFVRDLHDRTSADIAYLIQLADETMLGASSVPPETRTRIGELCSAARDAETAIGDLVWAATPQSERLPQLAARLRVRLRERLKPHSIEPDLSAWPAPVPDVAVSAAVSGQVLYVCHEVINNVVKHAQATKLISTLIVEDGCLVLCFRDSGQGFQPNSQPAGRRGLVNMRNRIDKLGGSFDIQSAPGQGTEVTVRLPLDNPRASVP